MQSVSNVSALSPVSAMTGQSTPHLAVGSSGALAHYQIIRRNGAVVSFEPNKIAVAMMKAFLAVHGTQGAASASVRETVDELTQQVIRALVRSRPGGGTFHIEDVQDQVELGLMRGGNHEIARAYVLYRERRTQERAHQAEAGNQHRPAGRFRNGSDAGVEGKVVHRPGPAVPTPGRQCRLLAVACWLLAAGCRRRRCRRWSRCRRWR